MATYKITFTQPTVYLDDGARLVTGYLVRVEIQPWSESHDLRVPSLDPKVVKKAAETLLENRSGLDELGE